MKWLTAFILVLGSMQACADSGKLSVPAHPKWQEECGSCHIAYPPQWLTGEHWKRMMSGLDKHFGANAVLDAGDNQEILAFLLRHAGQGSSHAAKSMRITDTPWFKREHDEISSKTWDDPAVRSRANCTACHVNAERGDWSERGVRLPGKQGQGHAEDGDDDDDDDD